MPAAPPSAPPPSAPSKPAAPVAAPAPSKPSTPSASPELAESDPSSWMGVESDDIDALDDTNKPPRPAPKDKPKAEDPPDEPEQPPEETPEQKPVEKPAEPDKPVRAADLRKAYNESQKKIREVLQPQVAKLEARVKELETAKPQENGALTEKYQAIEKRNAELEAHIQFANYEQSSEYQDKYHKPYVDAWERALADISQIQIQNEDGTTRKGNENDILRIANLPVVEDRKLARQIFGDDAVDDVIYHVRKVKELHGAQQKALADAQKNAKAMSEKAQLEGGERAKKNNQMWQEANQQLAEKYPRWFKPVEGDTEGNKLLSEGLALTKLAFADSPLNEAEIAALPASFRTELEQNKGQLTPQGMVRVHALIKNKAANHDRLARQLKVERAEHAETKRKLEEFEQSEPPGGGGTRKAKESNGFWDTEPNAELDEIDRRGRP